MGARLKLLHVFAKAQDERSSTQSVISSITPHVLYKTAGENVLFFRPSKKVQVAYYQTAASPLEGARFHKLEL